MFSVSVLTSIRKRNLKKFYFINNSVAISMNEWSVLICFLIDLDLLMFVVGGRPKRLT